MISTQEMGQYFFGAYMLYSGLNAFFHFRALPPQENEMQTFVQNIDATKIILPIVKIMEVLGGVGLLLNYMPRLWLAVFSPIVFFIVLSQLKFNLKRSFFVLCLILIPYFFAVQPLDSWYAFFASPILNP